MAYKIVVTKKCSACGNVLESERRDFCDGCNIPISQKKKDFDRQVRVYLQTKDIDDYREDLVFHNLKCFVENAHKIDLRRVDNVSLEHLSRGMFKSILAILETTQHEVC